MENVPELLKLADLLLLENTKKYLINYLKQTLNSQNCILYKRLGQFYCDEPLIENSEEFMARNYVKVMESEDFLSLSIEEFLDFLEHYGASIIVPSEDFILKSIESWISKDTQRTMVRQTQIHRKSNFRILESEGAQKLRTYITKKTPKFFQFLIFSLGATAISANPVFHEKGDFRVIFPILLIELRDQNYKTGSAMPPNYPSSPSFICQCSL